MAIVISEVNEEIRFLLGDLSTEVLSDTTLNKVIQRKISIYGDTDDALCEVTYYSLLDCLRYLSVQSASQSASTGTTGVITERFEKEGDVEVREKYSSKTSSSSNANSWDDILEDYIAHPEYVCQELVDGGGDTGRTFGTGLVIIGGVSNAEAGRVLNNPDSRNGLGLDRKSSYNDIFNKR